MLYVKKANLEDIEKEWAFVRDMPEDENGLTNAWAGISHRVNRDNPASLKVMQKNGGRIVKEDADHYYVRIKK